ncbi:MAG: nucleotidyltransferase [Kofleriaceae bacterium]
MQLGRDFRDMLATLESHGVRYLVVGGLAVAVHGTPRYTKDLDLWVECSPENASKLVAAINAFGLGSLGLVDADFLDPDIVIQLGYEPNRIDLLTALTGLTFADVYPKRHYAELDGMRIPIIDRESLLANKRALGRPHDLDDAKGIE